MNAMTATQATAMPPAIQLYAQSLAPQDRSKHRLWIGVRARALLGNYWTTTPSEAELEITARDWMDCLENYSPDEITGACKKWVIDNPRKRPNFGHIREIIDARRARILAKHRTEQPQPVEPEREVLSVEERQRIAAEMGMPVIGTPDKSSPAKWIDAEPARVSAEEWAARMAADSSEAKP